MASAAIVTAALVKPSPATEAPRVGVIEGVVMLEPPPPPRRTANRYPGGRQIAHAVQQIPPVVYLLGDMGGATTSGPNPSMMQKDTAFLPAAVAVPVGGTVVFPNGDPFFHNVFSYSTAKRFDLGRYPEGESKEVTFDEPGVVSVFCEVHDFMRGAIVVTENPFHAVTARDGTFRIEGVPEGEHTIAFWHPDTETIERTIVVTNGATTRIEVELKR
jgi:plastocyanin